MEKYVLKVCFTFITEKKVDNVIPTSDIVWINAGFSLHATNFLKQGIFISVLTKYVNLH